MTPARCRDRSITLAESLYYCVREAYNCQADPGYREADERILPALEILAASERPPDEPYLCPCSMDAFCDAMMRRGRAEELGRIRWLHVIPRGTVQHEPFEEAHHE